MIAVLEFRIDVDDSLYFADYYHEKGNIDKPLKPVFLRGGNVSIYLRRDHPLFNIVLMFQKMLTLRGMFMISSDTYRFVDEELENVVKKLLEENT